MSTVNIQPVVNANGETILSVFTDMGLYTCLLGPDFLMKMNEKNQQGSKVFGLGYFKANSTSRFQVDNLNTDSNLYIYFYNSQGSDPEKFGGKVPSFMDAALNCTSADITAKVSNKTLESELTSAKEGLVKERLGLFNLLGTMCGVTAYWPQGYGAGNFDSCCVSLVDLESIKDITSITSEAARGSIFAGTCFAVNNANVIPNSEVISYVRNNVTGVTDANTMLLKFAGRAGIWDYNILTGDITQSSSTYDGYFSIWGSASFVIDNVLYGLTNGETATVSVGTSISTSLFSYDTTTKVSTKSTSAVFNYSEASSLIKVGADLYINTNGFSVTSTSSSYKPTYKKITLSSLIISSTVLTLTVPEYLKNCWKINSFDYDSYLLHDNKNLISYKFTDISSIEGSITDPYFVCCGQPISSGVVTHFMAAHTQGYYYQTPIITTTNRPFKNADYTGCKYMLLDGSVGPLLSYGKLSKLYEKPADADFTSNYYITVTALNS